MVNLYPVPLTILEEVIDSVHNFNDATDIYYMLRDMYDMVAPGPYTAKEMPHLAAQLDEALKWLSDYRNQKPSPKLNVIV